MPKTGATRYQKFLKSDKAKTKLKSKKDLPKGTNVTKTNFKVKKIVLKEQLHKHNENEALSIRKLNVKELLTRLNHFNVQARTLALNGLSELITLRPDTLKTNLGQLIHGVTPLLLNIEKVVRRETLKVLHLILSKSPEEKVEPFYDFMSTYLRSGMTHIDINIQDDSLLFLDTLLDTSGRIAQDFHKVVPNFLDMISKQRIDSKPGRTLTVDLGSHVTTVKWRVKVLQRLQNFLKKFTLYNKIFSSDITPKCVKYFDEEKPNFFNLFNPIYTEICQVSCLTSSAQNSDGVAQFDEVDQFQHYLDTLLPLLLETWLEVCPKGSEHKTIETLINEDAAVLLKHIIEVITLIWSIVVYLNNKHPSSGITNWFTQKYRNTFSQHIFEASPYVTNIRSRKAKDMINSISNDVTDPKLVIQNLEICYLFIIFNPHINLKYQADQMKLVLDYVEKTIGDFNSSEVNEILVKILNTIFCDIPTNWSKNITVMQSLFNKIISVYFNPSTEQNLKEDIFVVLCRISLSNKYLHFQTTKVYQDWLEKLPDILLNETVTEQTVDTIHKFAVQNNQLYNKVVSSKLSDIIRNLPRIKVTNNERSIYKLYSILYWTHCWDNKALSILENHVTNGKFDDESTKYIMDTLKLRSVL